MRSLRCGQSHLRRGLGGALLMSISVLAVACSSAPQTFHPASTKSADAGSTPAPASAQSSGAGSTSLIEPPFGENVHIDMTSWLPADASETAPVLTAKDFLLAVLYADYTGDRDHRWRNYVSGAKVQDSLAATLAAPDVSTESFIGTMRLWDMHAVAATGPKGSVEVTECIDSARVRNTGLKTGKVLPAKEQTPGDQNYYSNSDVLAKDAGGQWRVIAIEAPNYYPEAPECKP